LKKLKKKHFTSPTFIYWVGYATYLMKLDLFFLFFFFTSVSIPLDS
jgi:hypothetical protein